jgi:hypothetical protein
LIFAEVSINSIAVDIDDNARAMVLAKAPPDLVQIGISVGTVVIMIDGTPAYDVVAAAVEKGERVLSREPRAWDFAVGERIVRIALVLKAPPGAVVDAEPDPEPIDSGDPVVRVHFRVVGDQLSSDSIAIDIDKGARTVVVGAVSADLGVAVGDVCVVINNQPSYEFLEGGFPSGEILLWDFAVGEKTVRLALIFMDESEQAPAREATEAPASEGEASFLDFRCEDWGPDVSLPRPVPEPWHKPMFANLPEIPIADRQYHERPPRPLAYKWEGWGREKDDPGERPQFGFL